MEKKTVVITGASSGIGKATAKYFAEKGWNVAATMRTPEKEADLKEMENIKLYALDVTKQETIDRAYEEILTDFGTVDVLVNNAGYAVNGPFELSTDSQIRKEFDVNVFGLFAVTRTFLKHFRARKSGMIVNISSMGGKITFPLISTYHATKFAVEGFSESLSYELNDLGIRVKLIEPGAIETDFYGRSMDIVKSDTITDYERYVTNFYATSANSGSTMYPASSIAALIYEATTDGTDTLRYAGPDAKQIIAIKETQGDEAYVAMTTGRFAVK